MDRETERLVWYVLGATRGGPMRMRILSNIMEKPQNKNSLARILNVNYRTIEHHVEILLENAFIIEEGEGYGRIYFPSAVIEHGFGEIVEMLKRKGIGYD